MKATPFLTGYPAYLGFVRPCQSNLSLSSQKPLVSQIWHRKV